MVFTAPAGFWFPRTSWLNRSDSPARFPRSSALRPLTKTGQRTVQHAQMKGDGRLTLPGNAQKNADTALGLPRPVKLDAPLHPEPRRGAVVPEDGDIKVHRRAAHVGQHLCPRGQLPIPIQAVSLPTRV